MSAPASKPIWRDLVRKPWMFLVADVGLSLRRSLARKCVSWCRHVPRRPQALRTWLHRLLWLLLLFIVSKLGCQVIATEVYHRVEHAFEDSWFFSSLRRAGFEQAMSMTKRRVAVEKPARLVIVDIARLPKVDAAGKPPGEVMPPLAYTPRRTLFKLLTRMVDERTKPAAVGFDIDFTPDEKIPAFEQVALLDWALEHSPPPEPGRAASPPRIYFAVGRGFDQLDAAVWLGGADFRRLAATSVLFTRETLHPPLFAIVPHSVAVFGPNVHNLPERHRRPLHTLISLSEALASAGRENALDRRENSLPHWFAHSGEMRVTPLAGEGARIEADPYFVNYGLLPETVYDRKGRLVSVRVAGGTVPLEIIEAADLLAGDATTEELREKLHGAIVLVGAVHPDFTVDKVIVPGRLTPVPGVFVHAAGVLTLLYSPLLEVNEHSEGLMGFFLSVVIGVLVHHGLHRFHLSHARVEVIEMVVNTLAVVLVAGLLASFLNVLWIAWPAAVIGCWVEGSVKLYRFSPNPSPTHAHP